MSLIHIFCIKLILKIFVLPASASALSKKVIKLAKSTKVPYTSLKKRQHISFTLFWSTEIFRDMNLTMSAGPAHTNA